MSITVSRLFGRLVKILFLFVLLTLTFYSLVAQQRVPFKADAKTRNQAGTVSEEQLQAATSNLGKWKQAVDMLNRRPEVSGLRNLSVTQILAYDRLKVRHPDMQIKWDESGSVPIFISASSLMNGYANLKGANTSSVETADRFFQEYRELLRIEGPVDFRQSTVFENGERTHVRFNQVKNGIPLWGKEIILHFNARGDIDLFTGRYVPSPESLPTFSLDITSAREIAVQELSMKTPIEALSPLSKQLLDYTGPVVEPILFTDDVVTSVRSAYVVEIRPNLIDRWRYFIDANTGEVIRSYNATCADGPAKAQATDLSNTTRTIDTYLFQNTHWMIDASRPMFNAGQSKFPNETVGTITTLDARNTDLKDIFHFTSQNNATWSDKSSVSAHYHAALTYEYFRTTHNRNAIDGKGSTIISIVNVTQKGQSMGNAFWNGKIMAYGNGDQDFGPFAGSLDIGTHEMTHGVTENSAGLEYLFQSGALNESFSDIFGCMVDRDDWKILDDVTRVSSQFPTGAARDLSDPHNGGTQGSPSWQPKHMNEFLNLSQDQDNGGVHYNSGIPNHAAYLLSEQITRDKAEKIFYCALTTKLTKQSKFIDFRLAIVRCAEEIYGANSPEVNASKSACDQVGITDGNPTKDPDDLPNVQGPDQMLFVSVDPTDPVYLWSVKLPGQQNDFTPISVTEVKRKASVSDDGKTAAFVDGDGNLRGVTLNTTPPNEFVIDNSRFWSTVALSKNSNLLALTTTLTGDNKIHVFDISTPTPRLKSFDVYTPSYSGSVPNVALYADAMDFTHDNTSLLFDCYNEVTIGGDKIGFWEINLMSVWSGSNFSNGVIYRVFPQEPKINVGNPVFSKNKTNVFAFDLQQPEAQRAFVVAVDILKGDLHQIAETTYPEYGHPSYRGDDRMISYATNTANGSVIFNVELEADALTAKGTPAPFVNLAVWPVWYRTGSRPVGIDEDTPLPLQTALEQNFPNPFNPSTTIRYDLAEAGNITLTVHDAIGRTVATLVSGEKEAGHHSAIWNGRLTNGAPAPSGVYFYKLNTGKRILTRTMTLLK